jgi:hypothetical protein
VKIKDNKKDKSTDVKVPEKDVKLDKEKDFFKDIIFLSSKLENKKKALSFFEQSISILKESLMHKISFNNSHQNIKNEFSIFESLYKISDNLVYCRVFVLVPTNNTATPSWQVILSLSKFVTND